MGRPTHGPHRSWASAVFSCKVHRPCEHFETPACEVAEDRRCRADGKMAGVEGGKERGEGTGEGRKRETGPEQSGRAPPGMLTLWVGFHSAGGLTSPGRSWRPSPKATK